MLSNSLYNPQQNYLYQTRQNQQNMPAPYMQMQNYAKLSSGLPVPQQQNGMGNMKSKMKDYTNQNHLKNNVISDTFIKPITNYIIPTIYNSKLDTNHAQYELKIKNDGKLQSIKPKIENIKKPVQNGTQLKAIEYVTQKPVTTQKPTETSNNSIKLILNNKTPVSNIPQPTSKSQQDTKSSNTSTSSQENTKKSLIPTKTELKPTDSLESHVTSESSNGHQQQQQRRNSGILNNNTHKLVENNNDTNYTFILHEVKKPSIESTDVYTTINELEAANKKKNEQLASNKKPRFKTIHIEPSMVREAIERNRLLQNAQPQQQQQQQLQQTNNNKVKDSKYNYEIGVLNKNEANKLNNFLNEYLAVEKEINSFYNNLNTPTKNENITNNNTQPSKNCQSNEQTVNDNKYESMSMKSSLNSLLSTSSQNPENHNTQAILPTSGYSSFNSQQSNKLKSDDGSSNVVTNGDSNKHAQMSKLLQVNNNNNNNKYSSSQEILLNTPQQDSKTLQDEAKKYFNNDKVTLIPVVESLIRNFGTVATTNGDVKEELKKIDDSNHVSRAKNKIEAETAAAGKLNGSQQQSTKSPVRVIKIQQNQAPKPIDRKSKSQEPNTDAMKLLSTPPSKNGVKVNEELNKPKEQKPVTDNNKPLNTPKDVKNVTNDAATNKIQNKIPTKIKPKTEKAVKVHHGVPPPPPVVATPRAKVELRTKHVSLSPTKHRESMYAYEFHKLQTNKSTSNQVDSKKIKEETFHITEKLITQRKSETNTSDLNKPPKPPQSQQTNKIMIDPVYSNIKAQPYEVKVQHLPMDLLRKSNEKTNAAALAHEQKLKANMNIFQQKFGTLYATHNRRQRHSIFGGQNLHAIKRLPQDSFEVSSFSMSEENGGTKPNGISNKTNLPNLNGVDYYYKSKNENKINVSNYLKIPQQSHSSVNIIDFDSLLSGQAFNTQWPPLLNPTTKAMEKSTSLPWMTKNQTYKNKSFYQHYIEENNRRKREGNGFLMLLPGIAIPIETDIADSDEEGGTR